MHFGAALRLLRVDAGISLRGLAEQVGVSSAYLSRVENGHDAPPTADRLVALAEAIGIPASLLVGLTDRVSPTIADYRARVPAANALFHAIAQRDLTTAQLAKVQSFLDAEFPVRGGAPTEARIAPLLARGGVVTEVVCTELDDLLDVLAARLARATGVPAASLARALREREHVASTMVAAGMAVPHAIVPGVSPTAVLAILRKPLAADTPDGLPFRAAFGVVHPYDPRELLALLGHLVTLAREDVVDYLATSRDPRRALVWVESNGWRRG